MTDLSQRQREASQQGREFEAMCETWLKIQGHEIVARNWRHPIAQVEIDRVTMHREHGTIWVECKGSWLSRTGNGLQRSDTLLKAIGTAVILRELHERRPYWLLCSHLPRPYTKGAVWLRAVSTLFDRVIELGSEHDTQDY
jgi:uncharacterized protein UPF0102